ncbi:MAG: right-handed parallel beta-helix repeat-containing protein [Thermoplasmata archaeon]|nr:right-handed parallel beta-helix repeat-containing protein [Thermoplasmata archaeon]
MWADSSGKASTVAVTLLLMTMSFAFLTSIPRGVSATTLFVGGTGPDNYTWIRWAVDDANPGDVIYVYEGIYLERVEIGKPLTLVGENENVTVIGTGPMSDIVVNISADWVNMTGFSLTDQADADTIGLQLWRANHVRVTNGNLSTSKIGLVLYRSDNNTIENLRVSNKNQNVYLERSNNNTLRNLTIDNASGHGSPGFRLYESADNTLKGNHVAIGDIMGIIGLQLHYSPRTTVANNTIMDNWIGIDAFDSEDCIFANNMLSRNSLRGMYAGDSLVVNNTIRNSYEGIRSSGSTMTRNTVYDSYEGIRSTGDIVTNNTFHNNTVGIRLLGANGTVIGNAVFDNTDYGIHASALSENNAIYHNNIVDNGVQALDDSSANHWDNGYPSGGNYWSDYAGNDTLSGPNQDQPGSDGIGDTPYPLDYWKEDVYPLMDPMTRQPPRPPRSPRAGLSGNRWENVTLNWDLSVDDGQGFKSVRRYEIYRNSTHDELGRGYQQIASLPNGTTMFVDELAGEGNPANYFYRICAIDGSNKSACLKGQAHKFTRPLAPGPNLVSTPLVQSNESIETVLQTMEYDKAWFFDSSSKEWKWYMKNKEYRRGLWNLNRTMGVWVNVTRASNLTVTGVVPVQTTIHLCEGWNLVSFPSFSTSYSVAALKVEIGVTRLEGYDSSHPYHLRVLGDGEILQAGYGYWVKVESDADWIVEVS